MMSSPKQDTEFELAALGAFKEARGLYVSEKLLGNAVIVLQHEGLAHIGIAQRFERVGYSETQQAWKSALNQYKVALDSANGLGLTFLSRGSAYWVSFCEFRLWARGWYEYETVLNSLLLAESFVDQQRQEVSVLRGMAAAVTKSRFSSHKHVRDMYSLLSTGVIAMVMCSQLGVGLRDPKLAACPISLDLVCLFQSSSWGRSKKTMLVGGSLKRSTNWWKIQPQFLTQNGLN